MSGMDEQTLERAAKLQQQLHRLERDNVALRRRLARLVPRVSDAAREPAPFKPWTNPNSPDPFPMEPTTPQQRWEWGGKLALDYPDHAMVPGPNNEPPDAYCDTCWKCHGPYHTAHHRYAASRCCAETPPTQPDGDPR